MSAPTDRKYLKSHEWHKQDGDSSEPAAKGRESVAIVRKSEDTKMFDPHGDHNAGVGVEG